MESPLISIVIPVYNAEKYLKECIESILKSFSAGIEIILVNDGARDASAEIYENFAERYSFIHSLYQENRGQTAARKKGLSHARGEWVWFIDADDWIQISDTVFQKIKKEMGRTELGIINFPFARAYEDGRVKKYRFITGEYQGREAAKRFIDSSVFFATSFNATLWSSLIRKSILNAILPYEDDAIIMGEDVSCMLLVLWDSAKVLFLEDIIYYYRIHENSFCRRHDKDLMLSEDRAYHFLKTQFQMRSGWEEMRKAVSWFIAKNLFMADYAVFFSAVQDYLFPYPEVKPGSRIALYGAGDMGNEFIRVLDKHQEYHIVAVVDAGWQSLKLKNREVKEPLYLKKIERDYDFLLITITDGRIARKVKEELVREGLKPDKIRLVEEKVLTDVIERVFEK